MFVSKVSENQALCVQVLTTLFNEHDSYALSQSDIDELLRDDEKIAKEKAGDPVNYVGYPVRPFYKEIGRRLDYWLSTGYVRNFFDLDCCLHCLSYCSHYWHVVCGFGKTLFITNLVKEKCFEL